MSREINVDHIKKLWVLDLVVKEGSLKKAALAAKVSPSAVSQSLTALERAFGRPLLVRERGQVQPTVEALSILDNIRPAFRVFENLSRTPSTPAPKISWMNFGTYESIAIDLLPGLIERLRQRLPNLRLGLRISRTSNLLTMVRKGELCSALITEVDNLDRFYVRELFEDRLGVYVSNRHPIARDAWSAVSKYGFGSLAPSKDGLPRYFQKFCRLYDLSRPTIHSDSFETLRASAAAGVLAAILPQRVAQRHDDLVEIAPPGANEKMLSSGKHRILVVSQSSCDPEETNFIAEESRAILRPSRA